MLMPRLFVFLYLSSPSLASVRGRGGSGRLSRVWLVYGSNCFLLSCLLVNVCPSSSAVFMCRDCERISGFCQKFDKKPMICQPLFFCRCMSSATLLLVSHSEWVWRKRTLSSLYVRVLKYLHKHTLTIWDTAGLRMSERRVGSRHPVG